MHDESDARFMAQALALARRGRFTARPNPCVGCVVVRDGEVVGRGFHRAAGEPHAEVHALEDAGERARGATVYVTLEPCAHFGRTPPCANLLVERGVRRVVVATADNNPQVDGSGLQALRDADIEVVTGVLESEARDLNRGFHLRMEASRPLVRLKMAMSLDGHTAMASGESKWITGQEARRDAQRLRARSSAVITGIGTVLADNPALTVRPDEMNAWDVDADILELLADKPPLRVVLDSSLRIASGARLFGEPGSVVVFHAGTMPERAGALHGELQPRHALISAPGAGDRVDLSATLAALAARQCNEVLVEAGPTLAGEFLRQGLADEIVLYVAPTLLGHGARPAFVLEGLERLADQVRLEVGEIRSVGRDLRITATLNKSV